MTTINFVPRPLSARALVLALVLALAGARGLSAQAQDARWLPWVGCWEPVVAETTEPSDEMLCIRPIAQGVDVAELAGGATRSTQPLRADGQDHALVAQDCQGTSSAQFSQDGRRVYTHTTQSCDGDVARSSSGLIAMVSPTEWVDVQAQSDGGESLSWVRRYRRATAERTRDAGFADLINDQSNAARRARSAAASAVDVDDVIEATKAVDAEAVRAWIAEMGDPFDLNGSRLIRMADAGVPANVIDVMVAVSYPNRFSLSRDGDVERLGAAGGRASRGYPIPVYAYPGYSRYGRYGYDRYGYDGYYGDYYGWDYYGPGSVIIIDQRETEPNAKVVKGKGYSRGNPPSGSSAGDSGTRSAPPASSPSSSPSSGSSGSSESTGSSSSGSSSSEGRTAKPREN